MAVLVGQQVDRHGSKKVLQTGNALQAVSFLAYPFVDQVWSVAFVVAVSVIGRTAFWGSYSPMVTLISPPGERELWFGFLGALRNAGFAIGGIVAGVALTLDATSLYYAVALLNAASYVVSFVLLAGVTVDESAERAQHGDPGEVVGGWATVLRDRGYRWLIASNLGYALTSAALNVAIPVYVVEMLGLPGWVSAAVFVINTLMIGVGQGLVVQRMTGAVRARIVALGAVLTASVVPRALGCGTAGRRGRDVGGPPGGRRLHAGRAGRGPGADDARGRVTAAGAPRPLRRDVPAVVERRDRGRAAALRLAARPRQWCRVAGSHGASRCSAAWPPCRCGAGSRTPAGWSPTGRRRSSPERGRQEAASSSWSTWACACAS